MSTVALICFLSFFCISVFASQNGNSLLIKSVIIIDGTGAQPTEPMDVEIIGNRISRIGQSLKSKASVVVDGTGKTLIPGLIDCHVHIRTVPGAVFRNEEASTVRDQQKLQLEAYLAAGVTTVLDAATPGPLFEEVAEIGRESAVPRFLGLAPFLTPKNGYFASEESRRRFYSDLSKPIEQVTDIRERIHEAQKYRPFGIKTTIEFGFGPFAAFPVFDSTYRQTIREEAAKAHLPIMVHTESEKAFWLAFDLKPYAFMHGGFFDKPASREIIQKIAESRAYVVSTLAIYKMMLLMWDQDLFEDPWFRMLVPPQQIKTAQEVTSSVVKLLAVQNKPWFTPRFVAEWFSSLFIRQNAIQQNYLNSKVSLKSMYDSGVPVVMGSDAGNYPLFSTFFHGVGSILEVEALMDAGIPATEVIRASTSRAAQMLKIDDELGTVSEGKIADLILLNQSPLDSSKAFRNISLVIKDGKAKPPRDWLSRSPIAEVVTFKNGNVNLGGLLFKPRGNGPFPAVLYNHGSAPGLLNSQAAELLGPLYVKHGWVFFMPYRRGQGLSEAAGPYIMDEVQAAEKKGGIEAAAEKMTHLLKTDHLDDQLSALKWLERQDFVGKKKIAVAGNSFGGIQTVLGAERESYCAAINASGAAQSWSNAPMIRALMVDSVRNSKAPIFFFQAENDFDLSPSQVLSETMKTAGKPYALKFYPSFGQSAKEGHSFAYLGSAVWEEDVFQFLNQHCKEDHARVKVRE